MNKLALRSLRARILKNKTQTDNDEWILWFYNMSCLWKQASNDSCLCRNDIRFKYFVISMSGTKKQSRWMLSEDEVLW